VRKVVTTYMAKIEEALGFFSVDIIGLVTAEVKGL
jgi:hypothetical protein